MIEIEKYYAGGAEVQSGFMGCPLSGAAMPLHKQIFNKMFTDTAELSANPTYIKMQKMELDRDFHEKLTAHSTNA